MRTPSFEGLLWRPPWWRLSLPSASSFLPIFCTNAGTSCEIRRLEFCRKASLGSVFKAALIIIPAFRKVQIGFLGGGDSLPDAARPDRCREPVGQVSERLDPKGIPRSKESLCLLGRVRCEHPPRFFIWKRGIGLCEWALAWIWLWKPDRLLCQREAERRGGVPLQVACAKCPSRIFAFQEGSPVTGLLPKVSGGRGGGGWTEAEFQAAERPPETPVFLLMSLSFSPLPDSWEESSGRIPWRVLL